jgi:subtilisin-like proprotein convertase family protein
MKKQFFLSATLFRLVLVLGGAVTLCTSSSAQENQLSKETSTQVSVTNHMSHACMNNNYRSYPQVLSSTKSVSDNGFLLMEQIDVRWDDNESAWKGTYRFSYTYDLVNNNLLEELTDYYTDSFIKWRKETYLYDDENNNLVEFLISGWDTNEWKNGQKHNYWYNTVNNNLIEERSYTWSMNTEWRNYQKFFYTYDASNNLIQTLKQGWYNGFSWENDEKNTYLYYGENNNLIENVWQNWDGSDWVNYWRYIYLYDEDNNPVEIKRQSWGGSEWIDEVKYLQTFDESNNMTKSLSQTWDESGWKDKYKTTFTYDQNNNQIKMLGMGWFEYEGEAYWKKGRKSTMYYLPENSEQFVANHTDLDMSIEDFQTTEDDLVIEPGKDDKTLIGIEVLIDSVLHTSDSDLEFTLSHNDISVTLISQGDASGENFIQTKMTDNAYDEISDGFAPYTGNFTGDNVLSSFLGTDPVGTWTLSIYDGVEGNTGVLKGWGLALIYSSSSGIGDKFEMEQFELFPNPAVSVVSIQSSVFNQQSAVVEIYDLNGKKLAEKYFPAGSEEIEMDVSHLKSGVYFCTMITEQGYATKKLIIQK